MSQTKGFVVKQFLFHFGFVPLSFIPNQNLWHRIYLHSDTFRFPLTLRLSQTSEHFFFRFQLQSNILHAKLWTRTSANCLFFYSPSQNFEIFVSLKYSQFEWRVWKLTGHYLKVFFNLRQGSLTEGEGSVQLTSLSWLV